MGKWQPPSMEDPGSKFSDRVVAELLIQENSYEEEFVFYGNISIWYGKCYVHDQFL